VCETRRRRSMSSASGKDALEKSITRAKSQLKVSKAKLHAKIKSIDGLEKVLPRNFRKPTSGEELILEQHSVLYLAYACIVAIAAAVFVGQWTYYGGLKEAITDITDDSSSGGYDSCKALQGDPIYNVKWTYETCKEKEESGDGLYAKLSNATSIVEYGTWGNSGWGYRYFPFAMSSESLAFHDRNDGCSTADIVGADDAWWEIIPASTSSVHNASCSQYIDQTKCAIYYRSAIDGGKAISFVAPSYALIPSTPSTAPWASNAVVVLDNGSVANFPNSDGTAVQYWPPSNQERCTSYEKQCATRALEVLLEATEACHPCYTLKENSPFLCTTSKGKTVLEILSLSVSNTLAVFSFLVALAPMILSSFANRFSTRRASKEDEEEYDDEEDDCV